MSNCVTIWNDVVVSNRYFDGVKLLADIAAYEAKDLGAPGWGADTTDELFNLYWFLGSGNVHSMFNGKATRFEFGHHRSSHTWRDLKGMERFLSTYLKLPAGQVLRCPCRMSDEFDGFNTWFHGEITLTAVGDV
jgi:hypothetical protein